MVLKSKWSRGNWSLSIKRDREKKFFFVGIIAKLKKKKFIHDQNLHTCTLSDIDFVWNLRGDLARSREYLVAMWPFSTKRISDYGATSISKYSVLETVFVGPKYCDLVHMHYCHVCIV